MKFIITLHNPSSDHRAAITVDVPSEEAAWTLGRSIRCVEVDGWEQWEKAVFWPNGRVEKVEATE